eukprot:6209626-Pleurochrysis_carterae.AAC.1
MPCRAAVDKRAWVEQLSRALPIRERFDACQVRAHASEWTCMRDVRSPSAFWRVANGTHGRMRIHTLVDYSTPAHSAHVPGATFRAY